MDPLMAMRGMRKKQMAMPSKMSMAPVGKSDSPQAGSALAQAKSALAAFVRAESDPADKATAAQALKLLARIAS